MFKIQEHLNELGTVTFVCRKTSVARSWVPRVSPRRWHKFHEGEIIHGGRKHLGDGIRQQQQVRQQRHTFRQQTDKRTDRQTEGFCGGGLIICCYQNCQQLTL